MKYILYMLLLTGCLLFCVSCESMGGDVTDKYDIIYLDSDVTGLVEKEYETTLSRDETVALVEEFLKQLQSGGEDANSKSPISENVEILDYQIKNTQLSLFFSAAYNEKSGIEEILSRAAIVESLCQIDGISYVEFYVEDQPLMLAGNAVGLMNQDSFVLNLEDQGEEKSKQVTLYFANAKGTALRAVSTSVTYNSATPLAKMLVERLIHGEETIMGLEKQENEIIPPIPEETVLNSLTIRDQVCYVDLGSGFNNLLEGISSEVSVYALVNTLCELPNVNHVQFTIDGEPQDKYGEMEHFSSLLERKLDLVEEISGEPDWTGDITE